MDTPSDRVQVRQRDYLRHPGTCALCGSATCIDGYVDPDIYFEWEGNIYFCMNCAKQIAHVIGCLLPAESKHLEELNNTIAEELKETKEKLNEYAELDTRIRSLFGTDSTVLSGLSSVASEQGAPEQPADPPKSVSPADSRKSEPKEPTSQQGPIRPRKSSISNTGLNV